MAEEKIVADNQDHDVASVPGKRKKWLKRMLVSTVFVLLLVVVFGWFFRGLLTSSIAGNGQSAGSSLISVKAKVKPLTVRISLAGTIGPLEELVITAPFQGKVSQVLFSYGQKAQQGELLAVMDTVEMEEECRKAKAEKIKAEQELNDLRNWEDGAEVSEARRRHIKARNSFQNATRKLEENQILYAKGIISENEVRLSRQEKLNTEMDFAAAREELDRKLNQGNSRNIEVARLELANAAGRLDNLQRKLKQARIRAEVQGVVLNHAMDPATELKPGVSVNLGDALFSIGNMAGISVRAMVGETELGKLEVGQPVIITGSGFDFPLSGTLRHIGANAVSNGDQKDQAVRFEIIVVVDNLTEEQQAKIRLGMSAKVDIVMYENPEALLIPIMAITMKDGKSFVTVKDEASGRNVVKEITPGIVELNEVEVLAGLEPGEKVLLARPVTRNND
jgi:HlyD family secretion protein